MMMMMMMKMVHVNRKIQLTPSIAKLVKGSDSCPRKNTYN